MDLAHGQLHYVSALQLAYFDVVLVQLEPTMPSTAAVFYTLTSLPHLPPRRQGIFLDALRIP